MKKRVGICFVMMSAAQLMGSSCCAKKLDALSATVLRLVNDGAQIQALVQEFQEDCCPAFFLTRAGQCTCSTTPITAASTLPSSGSYCLANDITGDINATSVQANINLNGHTVTGSVLLGEHGYVCNGRVTDRIILGSNSRAESMVVNGVQGNVSLAPVTDVVLRDVIIVRVASPVSPSTLESFKSLTLDSCVFAFSPLGSYSVNIVEDLTLRNVVVYGDLNEFFSSPISGPRVAMYNTQVTGAFSFTVGSSTDEIIEVWDSSFGGFSASLSDGEPVVTLRGVESPRISLAGAGSPTNGSRIFIDECVTGRIILSGLSKVCCQNSYAQAFDDGGTYNSYAPVDVEHCHDGVFDHVQAFNDGTVGVTDGFKIYDDENFLIKNCYAVAELGRGYDVLSTFAPVLTSTQINIVDSVAKSCDIGFFSALNATGSVMRCLADGCDTGFGAANTCPVVFASNVSCLNTANYNVPHGTAPFYDANYTTTAGSWRNISQ